MSTCRTPYVVKTRQQAKREQDNTTSEDNLKKKDDLDVKSEPLLVSNKNKCTGAAGSRSTHTSSSAERKRLELEAARKQAQIDLQAIEAEAALKKSQIQKLLVHKELEADLAELELEENSRRSIVSSKEKVQDWFNKSDSKIEKERVQCGTIAASNAPQQQTNIHELTVALQEASKSQNRELLTRLATSKDLPIYFGDPLEWLQFKNAFFKSTELCNYSDTENVWRLRKCLRGEAKEAVSSLLMGCVSPYDILDTLELRFGRPEVIMNKIVSQLKKIAPLPQAYHSDLVQFSIKIKNYVAAASAIKQMDYLRSPELVTIIVSKLPISLVTKWADYTYTNLTFMPGKWRDC